MLGGQIFAFAALYQMWEMTGSPLMTGTVGLALAAPTIVFGMWGGLLADMRDRRGLILISNIGTAFFAIGLTIQALIGLEEPTLLLALAAANAGCLALGRPARKAMIPDLLPREEVGAGIALTHASFQAAMLGGPALGGIVAGLAGVEGCYAAGALTILLAFRGLLALPKTDPIPSAFGQSGRVMAGLRAIWTASPLRGSLLTDLAAMALAMPVALFPALNEARFGGTPETLGLFLSAMAAGGIAASLLSGALTRYPSPGAVQLYAAAAWGISLAGAGLAASGWATLAFLAAAGAADTASVIARGTVVQLSCDAGLRGRVSAAEQVVGAAAPQLGNFRAGAMGAVLPPGVALACGGVLSVAAVVAIAVTHPGLCRFRTDASE